MNTMYGIDIDDWVDFRDIIWGHIGFKPHEPNQKAFVDAEEPNKCIICGNQFGKSRVLGELAALLILIPNKHVGIVGALTNLTDKEVSFAIATLHRLIKLGFLRKSQLHINKITKKITINHGLKEDESWIMYDTFKTPMPFEGEALDLCIIAEASHPHVRVDWMISKMPSRLITRNGCWHIATTPLEKGSLFIWLMEKKVLDTTYFREVHATEIKTVFRLFNE